jgi:hypothetical protein
MAGTLRRRVAAARSNLSQARAAGDDYGADTYAAELEDLLRRAATHGITIEAAGSAEDEVSPADEDGAGRSM